jgi:molybdenum cofactor cytidylyltransferase
MPAVAVVPAAGKGERFGGAKLLAKVGDDVLLDRTLRSLVDGGASEVVVVLAPGADLGAATLLADPRVRVIRNPDPSRGMFSSIQCGLAAADGDPILVLPADMPFVKNTTVAAAISACERTHQIVLPTHRGKHGHPVALPASICKQLVTAPPDSNLKAALAATGLEHVEVAVDDAGVLRDVDVVSDL